VTRAGREELTLVWEVVVNREALDAGAPGDLGYRGASRAHLLMERRGHRDDAQPGLILVLGAGFEHVLSLLI